MGHEVIKNKLRKSYEAIISADLELIRQTTLTYTFHYASASTSQQLALGMNFE